jgi:hypothetical protein
MSEPRRHVEEVKQFITIIRGGSNGLPLWNETAYITLNFAFPQNSRSCIPNHCSSRALCR